MKCSQASLWAAAILNLVVLAAPALASNNPLAGAMGNLRWGMRNHDVKSALKGDLADKAKLTGLEKSYVEFDGSPSTWDSTPLAEEYTHGNDESMMSVEDDEGVKHYFFFIGGELWKWVKLYPTSAFGARDFNGFTQAIERKFGKGHAKKGEVNAGSGKAYRFIEYTDRNTRVRAIDKTKQQGRYALVFESLGTVRSLGSLRANSRPGASARAMTAPDKEDDDSTARDDAPQDAVKSPLTTAASSAKGRSIFGGGARDEAKEKPRPQANARKAPAREDRARPDKQTRSLDKLVGDDDDDPLSGLPQ